MFLVDNGSPWGGSDNRSWTKLGVWLLKLGVGVIHSRPYHPQTRGKNERFHQTVFRYLDKQSLADTLGELQI